MRLPFLGQKSSGFGFFLLLFIAFILSLILPRFRVVTEKATRVSWYGKDFHGRPTASGKPYNMLKFTAAHRTLPLGSWLRVTNLDNGSSAIVQVTDRGPYRTDRDGRVLKPLRPHPSRTVDLSYWAARKLGMLNAGVIRVEIQRLEK